MYRILCALTMVSLALSLVSAAHATLVVSTTTTITSPTNNPTAQIPTPPVTGSESVSFTSTHLFKVDGAQPNYSFSISGGDYYIACDGSQVASSFFGTILAKTDPSGHWGASSSLSGSKVLLYDTSHSVTAYSNFSSSLGSGTDTASITHIVGPFTNPNGGGL